MLGLIHQEICCSSIASVSIKSHKDWSKKQVKKSCSLSLDSSHLSSYLSRLNMKLDRWLDTSSIYRELRF